MERRLGRFLTALEKVQAALGEIQDASSRAALFEAIARNHLESEQGSILLYAAGRFAGGAPDHATLLRKASKHAARAVAEKPFLEKATR